MRLCHWKMFGRCSATIILLEPMRLHERNSTCSECIEYISLSLFGYYSCSIRQWFIHTHTPHENRGEKTPWWNIVRQYSCSPATKKKAERKPASVSGLWIIICLYLHLSLSVTRPGRATLSECTVSDVEKLNESTERMGDVCRTHRVIYFLFIRIVYDAQHTSQLH